MSRGIPTATAVRLVPFHQSHQEFLLLTSTKEIFKSSKKSHCSVFSFSRKNRRLKSLKKCLIQTRDQPSGLISERLTHVSAFGRMTTYGKRFVLFFGGNIVSFLLAEIFSDFLLLFFCSCKNFVSFQTRVVSVRFFDANFLSAKKLPRFLFTPALLRFILNLLFIFPFFRRLKSLPTTKATAPLPRTSASPTRNA